VFLLLAHGRCLLVMGDLVFEHTDLLEIAYHNSSIKYTRHFSP
jgi:hypothetical protein